MQTTCERETNATRDKFKCYTWVTDFHKMFCESKEEITAHLTRRDGAGASAVYREKQHYRGGEKTTRVAKWCTMQLTAIDGAITVHPKLLKITYRASKDRFTLSGVREIYDSITRTYRFETRMVEHKNKKTGEITIKEEYYYRPIRTFESDIEVRNFLRCNVGADDCDRAFRSLLY